MFALTTTVYQIVSDYLGMKKVSTSWVPRILTDEQKQNCVDVCTDLLCHLQAQPEIFVNRIVTQDERWIYHFDPETKRQSMVWKHASSDTQRNSRSPHLPGKSWRSIMISTSVCVRGLFQKFPA